MSEVVPLVEREVGPLSQIGLRPSADTAKAAASA